jgi:hypothetical protein
VCCGLIALLLLDRRIKDTRRSIAQQAAQACHRRPTANPPAATPRTPPQPPSNQKHRRPHSQHTSRQQRMRHDSGGPPARRTPRPEAPRCLLPSSSTAGAGLRQLRCCRCSHCSATRARSRPPCCLCCLKAQRVRELCVSPYSPCQRASNHPLLQSTIGPAHLLPTYRPSATTLAMKNESSPRRCALLS